MGYPTRSEIHAILQNLADPPTGTDKFFDHVHDDVHWTVTGHHILSGTWHGKAEYRAATWAKLHAVFADPGQALEVVDGEQGIIVGPDGRVAVELKTANTRIKCGAMYDQHYAWLMKFDTDGRIAEVKAWLDSAHLEQILKEARAN